MLVLSYVTEQACQPNLNFPKPINLESSCPNSVSNAHLNSEVYSSTATDLLFTPCKDVRKNLYYWFVKNLSAAAHRMYTYRNTTYLEPLLFN